MLVLIDKPGQLSNRLWAYSFFIVLALKFKIRVFIPHFQEYEKYFENLNRVRKVHFHFFSNTIFNKISLKIYRKIEHTLIARFFSNHQPILNIHFPDYNANPIIYKVKWKVFFINSWDQRKETAYFSEFKNEIRQIFLPKVDIVKKVESFFSEKVILYDVIIGVHIRKGDYKEFFNGAYYFEDSVYYRYMKDLQAEMSGYKVGFLLCSNECVEHLSFQGLNTFQLDNPNLMEDLYALSKCNFIIGPPSTFSMWASFYGNVPLRILKYTDEVIRLVEFSPIIYQNVFENNTQFNHISLS